jgi:hypothetical protein
MDLAAFAAFDCRQSKNVAIARAVTDGVPRPVTERVAHRAIAHANNLTKGLDGTFRMATDVDKTACLRAGAEAAQDFKDDVKRRADATEALLHLAVTDAKHRALRRADKVIDDIATTGEIRTTPNSGGDVFDRIASKGPKSAPKKK